jgi:hypothetical protein
MVFQALRTLFAAYRGRAVTRLLREVMEAGTVGGCMLKRVESTVVFCFEFIFTNVYRAPRRFMR